LFSRAVLKETSGIGTEATRGAIIETLLARGLLVKSKRKLLSTEAGRRLIDIVPEEVKDPGTTALWEQLLDGVAQGEGSGKKFIELQTDLVREIIEKSRKSAADMRAVSADENAPRCPECGKPMRRRKGKFGEFWGCTGYPECRKTVPVEGAGAEGKTAKRKAKPVPGAGAQCPTCKKGTLVLRTARQTGNEFYGCSRFPKCDFFQWR